MFTGHALSSWVPFSSCTVNYESLRVMFWQSLDPLPCELNWVLWPFSDSTFSEPVWTASDIQLILYMIPNWMKCMLVVKCWYPLIEFWWDDDNNYSRFSFTHLGLYTITLVTTTKDDGVWNSPEPCSCSQCTPLCASGSSEGICEPENESQHSYPELTFAS